MKKKTEQAKAAGPANVATAVVDELPEEPHIAKVMASFNEYFQSEHDKDPNRATEKLQFPERVLPS
jgi:hypothetical protein